MTLLAEDLLLLLLDDATGKVSVWWGPTDTLLGGAVLAELALAGLVTVEEKRSAWQDARVHPAAAPPADLDPILTDALATVGEKERAASDLVTRLGKGLEARLAERLAGRGVLERREGKVLGLFPRTT